MNFQDSQKRILAAEKLLAAQSTSLEKFESIRTLVAGLNPKVDQTLEKCTKAFLPIENLRKGDLIKLTAENLPVKTSAEKKRKKAILLLIRSWRELQGEIARVKKELDAKNRGEQTGAETSGQIAAFAKGPFGLITLLAVVIAGSLIFINRNQQTPITQSITVSAPIPQPGAAQPLKVIVFENKKIPLSELVVSTGPECTNSPQEAPHYHAGNHQAARALDGTMVTDPGGCGYGKVDKITIEEVE